MKPENFLLGQPGTPDEKKLFLVDLGLGEFTWFLICQSASSVSFVTDFVLEYPGCACRLIDCYCV